MAKESASCVHANISHFYFGIFSLRIFCLFKFSLKLWKKCLLLLDINSVTLFGSNSLKVLILCDRNSEKSFYFSSILKELSENVSVAWCKLRKSGSYYLLVTLWKFQYCLMSGKLYSKSLKRCLIWTSWQFFITLWRLGWFWRKAVSSISDFLETCLAIWFKTFV